MSKELDQFRAWVLSDTGVLCRELLGMNYDEDEGGRHINVGKGGIVDHGKTQEIIELLDDRSKQFKLIKAPRESRKSSILQGFVVRQILLNPNTRICYIGRTDDVVRGKSLAIRARLEDERVTQLFGEQHGDKWEEMEFTVASRTERGLQNATFTAFSQDSPPVGGRFNIVILDDYIDDKNVSTPAQNKKSKDNFALLQPLVARGGVLVVVGTTWADDDLYSDLEANPLFAPPQGGQVICGAGVRVITNIDGRMELEVLETGLTFPHLTKEYLTQKLHGMARKGQTDHFCRQYLNEATSRTSTMFRRQYFRDLGWGDDMAQLSGYLLTDTAVSLEDEGCYSVVAYMGIDAADNLYLLDLRVGHWEPSEFVNVFYDVLERWQPRVNHIGEAWEKVALATAFRDAIEKDSRSRKIRLHTIEMPRPPRSQKMGRIMRMHPVMMNKHFYVVDTVPHTFEDLDGTRVLWDPEGFYDARTKTKMPGGELVDEFSKATAKKDIPDALAMILEYEAVRGGHKRMCSYRPFKPRAATASSSLTDQRKAAYHAAHYHQPASDWWDRTLHEHGL